MKTNLKNSLSIKFLIPVLLTNLILLAVGGVYLYRHTDELLTLQLDMARQALTDEFQVAEKNQKNALNSEANAIGSLLVQIAPDFIFTDDLPVLEAIELSSERNVEFEYVRFLDPDGKPLISRPVPKAANNIEVVDYPIEFDGEQLGIVQIGINLQTLIAARQLSNIRSLGVSDEIVHVASQGKQRVATTVFAIMVVLLTLNTFIVVWYFLKLINKPLDRVINSISLMAEGDLNVRVDTLPKGEIGHLGKSINHLAENLQRSEQKLQAALLDAEAASVAKSQFLANISHEIRTPMNGVLGMAQLLEDSEMNNHQKEYVATIIQSGDSLLSIINDVLDFSKLDADMMTIESIPFDLERLGHECLEMFAAKTSEKKLERLLDFHPECPHYLLGDPSRVRQILMNLIGNAIKFTDTGFIRLGVSCFEKSDPSMIKIEVEDSGIGIKPESISLLFEEFTQADMKTTRIYGGTGLGLSIVKKLIDLMGGEIGVESTPGKGSIFWIKMPFAVAESPPVVENVSLQKVPILFIDDHTENCRIYDRLLTHFGLKVHTLANPDAVIPVLREAAAKGEPYRIAVIDNNMPQTTGLQLGREIRCVTEFDSLKLLLFSSYGEKGDTAEFYREGFNAYLNKPCRREVLQQTLLSLLAQTEQKAMITQHSIEDAKNTINERDFKFEGRVLLAEDIIPNQIIASKFMKRFGLEVDVAKNGIEAVKLWRENRYDIVIMDCRMPEMDGYEATGKIRHLENSNHQAAVPIIALTANATIDDRVLCEEAGMDDIVTKPYKRVDLGNCLEKWIGCPDAGR